MTRTHASWVSGYRHEQTMHTNQHGLAWHNHCYFDLIRRQKYHCYSSDRTLTFCQDPCFSSFYLYPCTHFAGPSPEDLGMMLNNFNLLAVAVVIAASVKTQIYGMRRNIMSMQSNLRLCAKHTHKFVRDPYGHCCAPEAVQALMIMTKPPLLMFP